ncbi:tRNA (guanosine(46)-N7)-methyltransferase TrmB [Rubellicoccus peritrichatus]|uniref:tRNA (guanine-N(7)-)-methyltransferase n=1 Tax=Rubellicoccus peritrichatus TaxID=3080537 RepID=A0AAQ3QSC5_9BACT|nr:tRNA (guanosine(46)-N7)-methyltransferase TrmB [Puniceicoccus sp. CR14]WOO42263.1 tRNA (guanosine(46)-N7)-methyltransferase TrmB [Puniceicoccus sp. CR14]
MIEEPEYLRHIQRRIESLEKEVHTLLTGIDELTLEFGCGHGHYLTAYAEAHPQEECLGLDLVTKRIEKANAKVEKRNLTYVRFLKAEAAEFLSVFPESTQITKVFMLFPDPWPKKRHFKNRMIQSSFLSVLAEKCPKGAQFFFRTDHSGYFDWTKEHFQEHDDWEIDPDAAWPFEQTSYFQDMMDSWQSLIAKRV